VAAALVVMAAPEGAAVAATVAMGVTTMAAAVELVAMVEAISVVEEAQFLALREESVVLLLQPL
jgi:hypothetical protein